MRGRLGGRIGVPFGPRVGRATGVFHLADVMQAAKYIGWPIVRSAVVDPVNRGADAPLVRMSADYGTTWPDADQIKTSIGVVAV